MGIVGSLNAMRFPRDRLFLKPRPEEQTDRGAAPPPGGPMVVTDYTWLTGCVGFDWRTGEPTAEERKEFSWYSDCPEVIAADDGGNAQLLMYSTHSFTQSLKRWMRLYVYHQAEDVPHQRIVRVGVFNRSASCPLDIGVSTIRTVAGSFAFSPQTFAELVALSADQTDLEYPVGAPRVITTGSTLTNVGPGWTILDTMTADQDEMLHRIYELSIAPTSGTLAPSYVVAAFTVPGPSSPNIDIGARGQNVGAAPMWPGDADAGGALNRLGVWRYSYVVQHPTNTEATGVGLNVAKHERMLLEVSPPEHRLANPRTRPGWELLGQVRGRLPRGCLGAFPLWTRVDVTFYNDGPLHRRVQLWLDNPFPNPQQGYWGAVKLLDSTPTFNWGLQPTNTAIVPHIGPSTQAAGNSAFLDYFQVPSDQDVTRRYLFMLGAAPHGGG
ncbi:MAG: hypothetical protein HY321_19325 [Armatimonadetes bacterium]|nr:hypothetical protein [Armatimonadota bacterium]